MKKEQKPIFEALFSKNIAFAVCKSNVSILGIDQTEYNVFLCIDNMFVYERYLTKDEVKEFEALMHLFTCKNEQEAGCMYELKENPFKKRFQELKVMRAEEARRKREAKEAEEQKKAAKGKKPAAKKPLKRKPRNGK